jgi:hypothetical protein
MQKLATAGVLVACIMLICRAAAAGHPHPYRLMLPCLPVQAWSAIARTNKLQVVDTRIDADGDTWLIWEIEGRDYWRLTFLPKNGASICVVGGAGTLNRQPANKENI